MALEYKTYEVTLAWRNIEDGDLGPEFTRTQIAWSEDEAVEIVTTAINHAEDADPDNIGLERINEIELRGVKEIATTTDDADGDVESYDDSGFKSFLA